MSLRAPTAAISIDVDALRFYGAIHGLGAQDLEPDPIYTVALPRFFALLDEFGLRGTVFFIASDVERAGRHLTEGLAQTHSELASHSWSHDYRLTKRSREEIEADLRRADAALSAASPDGRVCGFRAPGYNTTPDLLEVVESLGYRYDSSLLPAPAYWGARAGAVGRYRLSGRPSASLVGDLRAFWGPRGPYRMRPEAPWRPDPQGGLVEIPMAVGAGRVPLIGTSWVLFSESVRSGLLEGALNRAEPFVFEMHAIDLIDGSDGAPPELAAAQPDLRQPASEKIAAFRALFKTLADAREVCTLAEIAERAA